MSTPAAGTAFLDGVEILRTVLKTLAAGVAVCDADGKLVFFNPEAERILGVGQYEVGPERWSSLYGCFRPDTKTPYQGHEYPLARAIRGEEVLHELMFVRNAQQPAGVWISVSGRPLKDAAGNPRGAVAVFRDVTEAENALRRQLPQVAIPDQASGPAPGFDWSFFFDYLDRHRGHFDRLCRAVEQTADTVLITDCHGIIEYVNPAFERTTGYAARDVLGQTPRVLKSGVHDEHFYRKLWECLLAGEPFRGTVVNRKKSGELYWAEQTISPMRDERGVITHFVSVLKDVTEQRQAQEQEFHLRIAQEVQRRFYNVAVPAGGFDAAGMAFPAALTGGDYFDLVTDREGRLVAAIGDVSGHGFGAALVMAALRGYFRAFVRSGAEPDGLLRRLNRALRSDLSDAQFVTLLVVRLDPCERCCEYAGAGHVPGYIVDRTGAVRLTIDSSGLPLGMAADPHFAASGAVPLSEGDTVVLLTDGITEAENPEELEFGPERALAYIGAHANAPARELVDGLCAEVRGFCGAAPQRDDITAVICRLSGG